MPARTLPGLGLRAYYNLGEDGWDTTLSPDIRKVSALSQLTVLSRVTSVPGSPTDGDIHIITAGGDANKVAIRDNGAWVYFEPTEGWRAYDRGTDKKLLFDGSAWVEDGVASLAADEHIAYANAAGASEVIFQLPAGYINFTLEHVGLAGDANRVLRMQHSTDGVTYASSGYAQVQVTRELNTKTAGTDRTSDSNIYAAGSASGYYEPYFAQVGYLNGNPNGRFSIFPDRIQLDRASWETMGKKIEAFAVFPFSSSAARWLRLYPNAGNFSAGEIYLSGRKKIT